MVSLRVYNSLIGLVSLVGVGLSMYAYVIEMVAQEQEDYEAMCDINEHISCTKVFTSKYGRGFGFIGDLLGEDSRFNVPNSVYGIATYTILAIFAQAYSRMVTIFSLIIMFLANISSIYFAYLLYFVLEDLCIVCVATYAVNFVNFIFTIMKLRKLSKDHTVVNLKFE